MPCVYIVRNGFPGKNQKISLIYRLEEIQSIKILIREGINYKREIYLNVKNKGLLPLMNVGQPLSLIELENKAIVNGVK